MLAGIRVLDCSNKLAWLAGRVLADLGAEVIKLESDKTETDDVNWQAYNVNKRLVVLNLESQTGLEMFDRLVSKMDILIVCPELRQGFPKFFDYERLSQLNNSLIVVVVTPFGTDGPRAGWQASDLELMAAGGAMSLAGEPDSDPVRISVSQSYAWTGVQAAVAALLALNGRRCIGRGQEVTVSAQASVLPSLAFAPTYWDMDRTIPTRAGSFATGRSITGAKYRAFWPCKDGYLNFILYGGSAGRRTNEHLVAWMLEEGADLGELEHIDWENFDAVRATQAEIEAIEEPIARFFGTLTKWDFLKGTFEREMLGYPVFTVADISLDEQLSERSFWSDQPGPNGDLQKHCGCFFMVDGVRPTLRYPVSKTPEDVSELLRELETEDSPGRLRRVSKQSATIPGRDALDGVKVVEFGGYAAGPQVGKILANFGATVIHVEAPNRPDGFRLEYPPFKNGIPGLNRGACFAFFNDSKYGITLDIKKSGGLDLARSLVEWSDVAIENMRPGVIDRLGLGYETFKESSPGLVMLSTCNMGGTGPRAKTPGFGSQLSALAGFSHLTGVPDGPPMLLYGPYIDFIASNFGAAAVLAAVYKSQKTGIGARIDLSQYESGLMFLAGSLLDYHVNGKIANRDGNKHRTAAPHGAYCCQENRWLTLSCWSNSEFSALTEVMGQSELRFDSRFENFSDRKANEDALNAIIQSWCEDLDADDAACELQNAGIHAYPVNTVADVFSDPQLHRQRVWRWRRHPVMGIQAYLFTPFDLSETPGDITCAAPQFGADNDVVFREFLGLSDDEFMAYAENGVIGTNQSR